MTTQHNVLNENRDRRDHDSGPLKGWYIIEECGPPLFVTGGDLNIIRLDMPFSPSGKRRANAIYARHQNGRLHLLDAGFATMASRMAAGVPMTFKNGKPFYYLSDIDHGSYRVHGAGILRCSAATMARQPDGRWNFFHGK